jgi:hypothetical protein
MCHPKTSGGELVKLYDYFEEKMGIGVLATADADGKVNAALYARPHFVDENTAVFIMGDRLTHKNLVSNPYATYLFVESGSVFEGKRLYLKKDHEEEDPEFIDALRRRRCGTCAESHYTPKYVAYFHIDKVLPLVGTRK